ncbi:MAG: molybdopterin biosynthesis protein [Desulfobacterales bacterium]|nr:molybdopterin biosynthesis protein [Desulfobacterales bacterium]
MKMKRNVYLDMKSIEEARKILFDNFKDLAMPVETINSVDAFERVLAEPVFAVTSSPNFHAAAMDGVAVDAKSSFGANPDTPIKLVIDKDAFWINTGRVMPENTNAVIMIENLNSIDADNIEIEAPVFPWHHVRKMGEDIVATELLFPRGHKVDAYSMGALLSGGIFQVKVHKKPKVLIIPTGSELKQWENIKTETLEPGDVIESNSTVLGQLCKKFGAEFECHTMLKDDLENIKAVVKQAASNTQYDMIMIIGGSSAGSMDFAKPVISELGEVFVHGVTMMPGKPVLFGKVLDTPVFGIPGYPVSAIVAFEQLAGPFLAEIQKFRPEKRNIVQVKPSRKITSKLGQEEFIRVKIGSVDDKFIASQLPRGSGSITTLTEADGIIRIPSNSEGILETEEISAQLLKPLEEIEKTIVITGSHDNTLDLLSDQIREDNKNFSISSSHVGSMGGLMAIKKGVCHLAGAHLLDPEDGSYNISYIKKYLKDEKIKLVNLVMRDQGLIIAKNNPKKIEGLQDLKRKDITFINRQSGSGTRILLDYKLGELGITSDQIKGYENEEYTHMSVAVDVLSGKADTGLGINAAAIALNLDFIPVITEEYDLVIPERFFDTDKIQALLETIRTDRFKERVRALGGYSTEKTGEILFEV